MTGSTNPMPKQDTNGMVVVNYTDGTAIRFGWKTQITGADEQDYYSRQL